MNSSARGRLDPILNGLVSGLLKNQLPKAVVAPTGFDGAACLSEIDFEGVALAA